MLTGIPGILVDKDIAKIVDMAFANPHLERPAFVCKDCQNTGNLEVIKYYGKELMAGFPKPNTTVLGYNLFYKMCYIYYQSIIPELPRFDQFEINDDTIKAFEKLHKFYDPRLYYTVIGIEPCNQCKTNELKQQRRI